MKPAAAKQSQTTKSQTANPRITESQTRKPQTTKSQTIKAETAKPQTATPQTTKSNRHKPGELTMTIGANLVTGINKAVEHVTKNGNFHQPDGNAAMNTTRKNNQKQRRHHYLEKTTKILEKETSHANLKPVSITARKIAPGMQPSII